MRFPIVQYRKFSGLPSGMDGNHNHPSETTLVSSD